MGRNTDNAPIGHTCPMIDDVISFIESIDWDLNDEDESKCCEGSIEAIAILEKIRKANTTLREWGNEEYKRAEEFEKEVDYLNDTVKDLKNEVDYLKEQLQAAEKEIECLST